MPSPLEDRRPAITPQLAVRVAVLGGIAFVLFAVVFFRLWFLQVLTGEEYVSQARENNVRKVKIEAPRGNIVDRNGQMLVKTRVAPVVQIIPTELPAAELEAAEAYRRRCRRPSAGAWRPRAGLRALERSCAPTGAARRRPSGASAAASAAQARRAAPVPVGPIPAGEPELRSLFRRLGDGHRRRARARSTARDRARSPSRRTPT